MLERTAASLEPCSFHRILPSKRTPFKSSRRLHTSFWHHGAAEIELSSVWQNLVHKPLESFNVLPPTQANTSESLRTSTFILDFLYPHGVSFLPRRLPALRLTRSDRARTYLRGSVPRLFTSASSRPKNSTPKDSQETPVFDSTEEVSEKNGGPRESPESTAATDIVKMTGNLPEHSSVQEKQTEDNQGFTTTTEDATPTADFAKDGSTQYSEEKDSQEYMTADDDAATIAATVGNAAMNELQQGEQPRDSPETTKTIDDVPTIDPLAQKVKTESGVDTEQSPGLQAVFRKVSSDLSAYRRAGKRLKGGIVDIEAEQNDFTQPEVVAAFETAMGKLHDLSEEQHAGEFDNIWLTYHEMKTKTQLQARYKDEFFDYITRHRTMSHILALALKQGKFRFLITAWDNFELNHTTPELDKLDWREFEEIFTIQEMEHSICSFIRKMKEQETRTDGMKWPPEISESILWGMISPLMHRYAGLFSHSACLKMLPPLADQDLYETFLTALIQKRQKDTADVLYRQYRELKMPHLSGHIMENMMHKIYWPDNRAGMELAAQDLYNRFLRLTPGQHRRLMMLYARQGDAVSVQRQWDQYEKQMKAEEGEWWRPNIEEFSPLLHANAVRGELSAVRQTFVEIQGQYGPELNTQLWNILLNAHAKAQEYEAAIRVFNAMRQTVELDRHSFGTMMGMTGSRGDIEYTLDMYRMAKEQGIEQDIAIIDSVVEVYCQNDRLADAEKICEIATTSGEYEPADLTTLWNTALDHHAQARDLTAMNRILSGMAKAQIPYDGETYEALLRGLALCRQADHAYFILKEAAKTESFKPALHHYALLMAAYIRTKRPYKAIRLGEIIKNSGFSYQGEVLERILQALSSWVTAVRKNYPNAIAARRQLLVSALREFRLAIEAANQPQRPGEPNQRQRKPMDIRRNARPDQTLLTVTRQTRLLCFVFAQFREMATVKDVLEMWKESSPQASAMANPPLMLLSTLMLAAYNDRHYDEVENMWTIAFEDVKQRSQVSAPGTNRDKALPGMRFVLNDALRTMLRTYSAKQDPEKLKAVVGTFRDAGFHLDSKNWNYYIQMLATLKQWREAFVLCEEQLMPHWKGWYRVRQKTDGVPRRIPLELRRLGQDRRQPRPISFTLIVLSKAYIDLEQMAVWSTEAERLLLYITEKCPASVSAVTTQVGGPLPFAKRILRGQSHIKRAYDKKNHLSRLARQTVSQSADFSLLKNQHQDQGEQLDTDEEGEVYEEDADADEIEEDGPDEWYDMDAQDDENWTPMVFSQKMKSSSTPAGVKQEKKKKKEPSEPLVDSEGRVVEGFAVNSDDKPSF